MKVARLQLTLRRKWMLPLAAVLICFGNSLMAQSNDRLASVNASTVAVANAAASTSTGATSAEPPRKAKERFQDYRASTFSPWALFTPSFSAGVSQWRDFPTEWKQGGEGFGKRLASDYGSVVIENTISLGVTYIDHEDLRYPLSTYSKSAILKRGGHAFAYTLVPRKDGGGRRFGWSRLIGAFGSGFVANTWYPSRHSDMSNAVYLGGINLASDLGVNLLKEFIRPHLVFGDNHKTAAGIKDGDSKGN